MTRNSLLYMSPKCVVLTHQMNINELQYGAFKNDFDALDFICMFLKVQHFKGLYFHLGLSYGLPGVNVVDDGWMTLWDAVEDLIFRI